MSKDFPNGVEYYTKGTIELSVFFPEDKAVCQYCPYCIHIKELDIDKCTIISDKAKQIIPNPYYGRSDFCPITKLELED